MSCMCTSAKEKSGDKGSENYNKAHIETRDITGYPEILLLKIKGRENLSNLQIRITDSVTFGGYVFILFFMQTVFLICTWLTVHLSLLICKRG